MRRDFCARCGTETTGKKAAAFSCSPEADVDGVGPIVEVIVVCVKCYKHLHAALTYWARKPPTPRVAIDETSLPDPRPVVRS